MPLKKNERKEKYVRIMRLMLEGENKQAFNALASMCGSDTGLFWLVDYDEATKALADNKAAKQQEAA
ncbi:MAG: hypothetical protein U5L02_06190 [Rheinheimera sp.]|nr:hypothetical protein [Rheinheimera sp.]